MSENTLVHFGLKLQKRKYSFKLLRDEYALVNTHSSFEFRMPSLEKIGAYAGETGTAYDPAWAEDYRALCLENFDRNMTYFAALDKAEFDQTVHELTERFPQLLEVDDLNEYKGVPGLYVMVLDGYKQLYIGQTYDICKRIRKHWSDMIPFDRALLPLYNVEGLVMSIDAFRALDTTRIFAWMREPSGELEDRMITSVPQKFSCNRIGGGVTDLMTALGTMNVRR